MPLPSPPLPINAPLGPRLLSGTTPFPLFSTVSLPPVFSPFTSILPSLSGTCSPGAPRLPGTGSLPTPLRLPSTDPLRPLALLSLPAPFGQTRPNGGPSLNPVWPNRGPSLFSQTEGHGRTKALRSVKQDRTEALRSVLFGRTVPEGREALGASAEKLGRGVRREHVPGSGGRILGKRKEEEGRGWCWGGRRGWYRRDYRGTGGVERKKEDSLGKFF